MMRLFHTLCLALLVLCATVRPAHADGFLAPFAGFNFGGDVASTCKSLTSCDEKRLTWGVAFGTTHGIFGFEEDIAYARDFFGKTAGGDNAVLTAMTNFMLIVPAGPVRPFAVAGLGLVRPHAKFDAQSLAVDQNAFGYELGGGVDLFLLHSVGVRGDVRHVQTFDNLTLGIFSNQKLDFWRGSAGLVLRF
jgi:opacity protein-like surface antigen